MSYKVIFQKWFCNGTKVIALYDYKNPWKENGNKPRIKIYDNGARRKKGDRCFDFHIIIGYLIFNYCNYDLQKSYK